MSTDNDIAQVIKKQRSSNFELYRIIVMFMIVCHHYVVNSRLLEVLGVNASSSASLFYYILGAWGKTGINCFVLITGYFMCSSSITLRKFLKLILQVYFYDIVINVIFAFTGYHQFGFKESWMLLWPLKGINSNFVSCFLMFFWCIPFINVVIHNINKRQHQYLIALLLFGFSIVAIPPLNYTVSINYVTWFGVLYIVSSYLRLYPVRYDKNTKFWFFGTLTSIVIGFLSILYRLDRGDDAPYDYISDSNQILSLSIAVCSFMLFKNLRIPQSRFINAIASTVFGVLLIHANSDIMRQWLWQDVVDCVGHYNVANYRIYTLGSIICIFLGCSLIDYLRINTLEKYVFQFIDKQLSKWQMKI